MLQHRQDRMAGWPALLLLVALSFLGTAPGVQAEPCLRVIKNGVIYYHFSTKPEKPTPKLPLMSHIIRSASPQKARATPPKNLEPLIDAASRSHDLPPPLIKAVIRVESNFNPAATSPKGAQGLMQLMPATADQLQVTDPYDTWQNIWGGTRYLKMLLQQFDNRLPLALAAYNAGPQRVNRHRAIPPIQETQNFVQSVCQNYLKYAAEK